MPDPNLDGPYQTAEIDNDSFVVSATTHNVPIYCAYPSSGPESGPYPIVVIAHGFQLPASQYKSYARRLATFGYIAIAPDYPAEVDLTPPIDPPDNISQSRDLIGVIDWPATRPELMSKVNIAATGVGMTGHSLGGKLAILAASDDPRVRAAIVLDPVDGSPGNPLGSGCESPCVDVSALLPISIPTGFIGQGNGMGQSNDTSCAPPEENYSTFFARTSAPSLAVTILGATHMSFIDDTSQCFQCLFCNNNPTASHDDVLALSRSYLVAFFERYLRNNTGYETYLTGDEAKARYVDTGLVANPIETK